MHSNLKRLVASILARAYCTGLTLPLAICFLKCRVATNQYSLGGSKMTYLQKKVYFDQLLDYRILLLLFLHTLLFWHILHFGCWIYSIASGCQTVWIQIRPDILSGLIWVQTVCKVISRNSGQKVKYKTTC